MCLSVVLPRVPSRESQNRVFARSAPLCQFLAAAVLLRDLGTCLKTEARMTEEIRTLHR